VYSFEINQQLLAAPITPQAIPYLALFKHENTDFQPFVLGKIFSLDIFTLSKII